MTHLLKHERIASAGCRTAQAIHSYRAVTQVEGVAALFCPASRCCTLLASPVQGAPVYLPRRGDCHQRSCSERTGGCTFLYPEGIDLSPRLKCAGAAAQVGTITTTSSAIIQSRRASRMPRLLQHPACMRGDIALALYANQFSDD
jgi:hypothetical protein